MPPLNPSALANAFTEVRSLTRSLAEPLTPEDCQAQSMVEASPVKWHLAHTTWFFEALVLSEYELQYKPFHEQFSYLFNSYYNTIGERVARPNRGLMTRPSLGEVISYRRHVDERIATLLERSGEGIPEDALARIELGLHHEQQHQELLLTDVKHLLSLNPLRPAYRSESTERTASASTALVWTDHEAGVVEIGHPADAGFAFDNELPRHRRFVEPFRMASRLVTCGEYLEFMQDGGYSVPQLWLSDGWDAVSGRDWSAPLYWEPRDGEWFVFTLDGMRGIDPSEPVCHVSYFEADAYARWAGARLAREEEWEAVASTHPIEGNFVDSAALHPTARNPTALHPTARNPTIPNPTTGRSTGDDPGLHQLFGDVWEWTQSQYTAYPGYAPPAGAIGEYNGKFMCNQFVLRGGSCATPRSHIRRTYRNFFPPDARWQFSGIRLAKCWNS